MFTKWRKGNNDYLIRLRYSNYSNFIFYARIREWVDSLVNYYIKICCINPGCTVRCKMSEDTKVIIRSYKKKQGQTTIYKTLHRNHQEIDQNEIHKKGYSGSVMDTSQE